MLQRKYLAVISAVLIVALIFVSIVFDKNKTYKEEETVDNGEMEITVTLPEKIYVANEAVVEWMNGTDAAKDVYNRYIEYGTMDYTKPITLLHTIENLPLDCEIETQCITVTDKDYSKVVFSENISPEKRSVSLENLRPDTVYEYNIKVNFSDGLVIEKNGEFKTEPSPCFLFVDGIRNVRDIGTTKTVDGRQMKKYMLYRGTELDGGTYPRYTIAQDGKNYMLNVLNIKTEVDLRWYNEKTMKDALGSDVNHVYYPVAAYGEFFETDYSSENLKKIFSELSNPDAYPVYLHCAVGADRTGMVIYILGALLGLDEKSLYQEWECSVLFLGDSFYDEMDDFVVRFKKLPGKTMQEKAEKYLLSIGVTMEEIESIREILLTD